jgi:trans-2-enoyl-CoA reductase
MDGTLHQRMRRLVVHLRDQAETAGVLFESGTVERAPETVLSVHSVFKKAAAAENGEKSRILTGQGLARQLT